MVSKRLTSHCLGHLHKPLPFSYKIQIDISVKI